MEKASLQQIKEQNRNLALRLLFERPSTSRAEIARLTNLTRTTVSEIVAGLIAEGLVAETGTGSSIGGKSPILLALQADARQLVSLDLAAKRFSGALVNLRGEIRARIDLPEPGRNGEVAWQAAAGLIDQLLARAERPLLGISLAAPGLVNTREGLVINAVNMDWQDFPLGPRLQERYRLPVCVLNDCQAAALGEFRYGGSSPAGANLVVVRAGQGIGAGIILGGQLYQGDDGHAGEIGHMACGAAPGLPCRCGRSGCLETIASAPAVLRQAEAAGLAVTSLEGLAAAAASGEAGALRVIRAAGSALGEAIAHLAGGLNIHRVLLTGSLACLGVPWLEAVRAGAAQRLMPRLAHGLAIDFGGLKNDEAILGAAAGLLNDYRLLFVRKGAGA